MLLAHRSVCMADCFVGAHCTRRRTRTAVRKACDADIGAGVACRLSPYRQIVNMKSPVSHGAALAGEPKKHMLRCGPRHPGSPGAFPAGATADPSAIRPDRSASCNRGLAGQYSCAADVGSEAWRPRLLLPVCVGAGLLSVALGP